MFESGDFTEAPHQNYYPPHIFHRSDFRIQTLFREP